MSLFEAITSLESEAQTKKFLEDICSPAELTALEHRWQAAKLLAAGNTYQEIISETKLSSAIVSRVNRVLQYGNGSLRVMVNYE
jgi:TrpR-related protein YerC/YecD